VDLSTSPRYHKNRSLSAIDDVTVHVNITFTHDVFECEEREVSLRRLAASLITRSISIEIELNVPRAARYYRMLTRLAK